MVVDYKDENKIIIRCEDLFYPGYKGLYFIIEKTNGYGFFHGITKAFTKGEILDKYNITLPERELKQEQQRQDQTPEL